MLNSLLLLLVLDLLPTVFTADVTKCNLGEDKNCSECYVSQVTEHDRNQFEIQKVFFPPAKAKPAFVTVFYRYADYSKPDVDLEPPEVWFWATSTFFFFQPLHAFQFTSLFFSDLNFRNTFDTFTRLLWSK